MGPRPLGGLCFPLVPEEGVRDRMGLSAPAADAGTSEGLHEAGSGSGRPWELEPVASEPVAAAAAAAAGRGSMLQRYQDEQ